ncbi:MAG: cyclic nucleotide-binding domain-containing protein [Blastocatellia bacterium]|nr:cyclic nucleotide-binding domain-containing protein [Blastocatellia bacterium]
MEERVLEKDEILIEKGQPATTFFVVRKGSLGISTEQRGVSLFVFQPRMVLGETAIFQLIGRHETRTTDVYALEEQTVVEEYEPSEMIALALQTNDFSLPRMVLNTILATSVVNLFLLRNEPSVPALFEPFFLDASRILAKLIRQIEASDLHHQTRFIDFFRLLFHVRNSTRMLCDEFLKNYQTAQTIQLASHVLDLMNKDDGGVAVQEFLDEQTVKTKRLG